MSDLSDLEELIDLYRVRKRSADQLEQEHAACQERDLALYVEKGKACDAVREVWRKIEAIIKGKIDEK